LFIMGCPPHLSCPCCQISPWYSPCEQWLAGVLAGASAVVCGGSVVGWFRVPSLVIGCGPSRSSWWSHLHLLVVVPFVRCELSPLVRSSWWSPSFVMCGPPLNCRRWCAVSTRDPPCEQWLTGLGTGAGSFLRTNPASRGSQRWWWWVVIIIVQPLVVMWQPAPVSSGSQSSPPFRLRSTPQAVAHEAGGG
jgi:hypothetical protein